MTRLCFFLVLCFFQFRIVASSSTNTLEKVEALGLPILQIGRLTSYYSQGGNQRAEKLAASIEDARTFYQKKLGISFDVRLSVLSRTDWQKVCQHPYGLPNVSGSPPMIIMPSETGGLAFQFAMARKEAIPPATLTNYLKLAGKSFESVAEEFVDIIGFHELGHVASNAYGIDSKIRWLNEFLASYFAYAYLGERRVESKQVFDLLAKPSKNRPKHTTLDDFQRLYGKVDDYGWYQGMFESRITEVYPRAGIEFLKQVRLTFPNKALPEDKANKNDEDDWSPKQAIEKLELIVPGFREWAKGFDQ